MTPFFCWLSPPLHSLVEESSACDFFVFLVQPFDAVIPLPEGETSLPLKTQTFAGTQDSLRFFLQTLFEKN